ncbi:MAG: hypothetical protein NVSMB52_03600 [Chloroflexota bacterium]
MTTASDPLDALITGVQTALDHVVSAAEAAETGAVGTVVDVESAGLKTVQATLNDAKIALHKALSGAKKLTHT